MDHRSRVWIRRRLRGLATLELLNIPLQAFVWFGVLGFPTTVTNGVGFALFTLLLVQGACYWSLRHRRVGVPGPPLPRAAVAAFRVARVANVVPLLAGLAWTVWAVADAPGRASVPGLGFALFAVLEYVNYFHVQLSYDTGADLRYLLRHGFRRAHLARDLSRPAAAASRALTRLSEIRHSPDQLREYRRPFLSKAGITVRRGADHASDGI